MFWYLQVNHRSRANKNLPKLPHATWSISSETRQSHNYEQIFASIRHFWTFAMMIVAFGGKCLDFCLAGMPSEWTRTENELQNAKCKKRRQLSLSLINVGHVVSARGGGLWITWFYRLINGDSRQQLLEHAESRAAWKSPDVDIDQSPSRTM